MAAADISLGAAIGVSAQVVEDIRRSKLSEGEHWTRADGGRVEYTADGIAALCGHLDLPLLPPEKKEGPPAPCLCSIERMHANPAFVQVRTPGGALENVRVTNNATLRPRLKLQCRQLDDGRWECIQPGYGVRLPPISQKKETAPPAP
jgi:hypothetical protein